MMEFEEVLAAEGLEAAELTLWVEERWVLPARDRGRLRFTQTDLARVRLINELRRDLSVDDEALPIVLSLLDQLYALRRQVRALRDALESLPPDLREALAARAAAGGVRGGG
jgi:chaperone modulatory protein CbpM